MANEKAILIKRAAEIKVNLSKTANVQVNKAEIETISEISNKEKVKDNGLQPIYPL